MKKAILVLILILPLFLYSQYSGGEFKQLEDSILKIIEENNIPGVQFAVTDRDSTLWLGNLGFADKRNNIPVTSRTLFRIGSITKSFTAVATMMLVERGKLSLSDRLTDLAPEVEFTNPWEETHPVSIANLLEHTTGFDDIHLVEYAADAEGWTNLEGLEFHPDSRTSRWRPGMHTSYCNSGPVCVGVVIENLSGQTYEAFVEENVFEPLGMKNSNFFNTEYTKKHLSVAYRNEELEEAEYWHIMGRPSGAINSTAEEMSKYIRFFMNRGMVDSVELLTRSSIERIEHPQTTLASKAGFTQGYGLNIVNSIYRGVKHCGHNGGMDGFRAAMSYFPDLGVGYVFMVNNTGVGGFGEIDSLILDFVVPDSLKKDAREAADTTLTVTGDMIGWYRSANSRAQIAAFAQRLGDVFRIIEEDGKYYSQEIFSPRKRVYPIDDNILIRDSRNGKFATYVFVSDEEGHEYIQMPGYGTNYIRTSGFSVWFSMGLVFFILLMFASVILAALIWVPILIFKKKKYRFMAARLVPLLAILFLTASILPFMLGIGNDMVDKLGKLTISSFSFFFFSILFAVTSFLSLIVSVYSFKRKMNRLARLHAFTVSLCLVIATVYLLYYDMIGLRLWAY